MALFEDAHGVIAAAVPDPVKVAVVPAQRFDIPVIEGNAFTVTVIGEDVALHPLISVAVTVIEPLLATDIAFNADPVLHTYEVPPPAVKVTEPPAQNVIEDPAVIVAVGNAFTVTVVGEDVALHPLISVAVTVIEPLLATDIAFNADPVLHIYEVPPPAVKFTDSPAQIVVSPPAVMVAVGNTFTVTVAVPEAELLQPATLPSDTDTSE
ncbi:MAG TPA: hypothetical protein VGE25_04060 [Sediminibacterium sp.]